MSREFTPLGENSRHQKSSQESRLRLDRLDREIFDRLGNFFKPMRHSRWDHNHVTLCEVVGFSTLNTGAEELVRPAGFAADHGSTGDEGRLTFDNVKNVRLLLVYFDLPAAVRRFTETV